VTRIISGKARGRRLAVPASGTRPTADRIRESLFASVDSRLLSTGRGWADISTCDLWAGSGAVALEAWSRGSGRVLAVDKARHAVETISANVDALGAGQCVDVRRADVRSLVKAPPPGGAFDLVFADPPYEYPNPSLHTDLANALASGWCAPGAFVVVERSAVRSGDPSDSREPFPEGVELLDRRTYGDTVLWYGQAHEAREGEPR
jgi:16S rRNA (guanine966-N2)-methyltransferase